MPGLNDTDIMLDENWQLTQAANGDAPIADGFYCFMQDIKLEAITQEGDLFYAPDWGWSLTDFMHSSNDDITKIEIQQRIKSKLEKRDVIAPDTISTEVTFDGDTFTVFAYFRFAGSAETRSVTVSIDRVSVEVTAS